jgi:hypothetical protein
LGRLIGHRGAEKMDMQAQLCVLFVSVVSSPSLAKKRKSADVRMNITGVIAITA